MESSPIPTGSHAQRGASLRRRAAISLIAILLLLPFSLRAALQFDTFLGLDGFVPEASWFPIVCEVYNDGPAFNGTIEVTGDFGQDGYPRYVPVELPTGTRKRITIPVFSLNAYNGSWNVRLLDAGGKMREERLSLRPRQMVQRGTVLIGSVSRQASWTPTFKEPVSYQRNHKPLAARFLTPLLPDNPIVLEGMNALYLSSERASDLRAQQVSAIESWIASGGHLIVAVDQIGDVNSLPWLRNLVPVELSGIRQMAPGDAFEKWLRSPIKESVLHNTMRTGGTTEDKKKEIKVTMDAPFSDTESDAQFGMAELSLAVGRVRTGEVVLSLKDAPAMVTCSQGMGRITVLLFSPEREPFKSWKNQPAFWSRLTDVPPRVYASSQTYYPSGYGIDGVFGAMIDSRQVRKLPIWQLFLMLLAYLAIIGPVDQIWLRKIGKPMLTWVTFPCYVALFSALIYVVGYKLRAGESEWNELNVVDVFPSDSGAELRGRTFGSIYSPVNQRYTFKAEGTTTTFRGEYAGSYSTSGGNDRGKVLQSENSFGAEVFVPVWTCQLFVSEWLRSDEAPFFASVESTSSGWKLKVQNRLDKPLTHLRLVVDGKIFDLDNVPARQMKEFPQNAATSVKPLSVFVGQYDNQFQSAVNSRRSAFGGAESGRLNDLPNCSAAASFVAYLNNDGDYTSFVASPSFDLSGATEHGNAVLLAWGENQSPAKPLNQFSPRRSKASTLWRMTLPVNSTP